MIAGEPGIGKTRLVEEVGAEAASGGMHSEDQIPPEPSAFLENFALGIAGQ